MRSCRLDPVEKWQLSDRARRPPASMSVCRHAFLNLLRCPPLPVDVGTLVSVVLMLRANFQRVQLFCAPLSALPRVV